MHFSQMHPELFVVSVERPDLPLFADAHWALDVVGILLANVLHQPLPALLLAFCCSFWGHGSAACEQSEQGRQETMML